MRRHQTTKIVPILLLILTGLAAGCSTQKNTAKSRWWHSFNARYNTYYNGSLAYIDASTEKENAHKDNFTEMIPLYTVGNKNSREIGKGNYEKAIEKCQKAIKLHSIKKRPEWTKKRRKTERDLEWLSRKEYNPFLWKAWLLMGRSQFYKGAFDEAASTFNYMSRLYQSQPAIYGRARAWLAKCYIEQDWIYDAEDVIRNMRRDSIHWRAQKEWDYTMADYYIHTGDYAEAVPYLRKVIKHEMRKKQKAREYYLLGQLEAELGHQQEAYKAYKKVIAQNPPYEIEFNARIAMTEVMAGSQSKAMISRLKRMAASDKNKDYLDQVYYALGNIYLAQRDTMQAISAYEKGNEKATRSGIEKGVLLLKLGDLYWLKEKFSDAQRCYGEAIGLLDKERKDYEQLANRSKVLDELGPYTDAIHLQDSLQALAKMSEKDRNAAIDRVIEALKKKEKEEKRKQAEADAQQQMQRNGAVGNRNQTNTQQPTPNTQQNGKWYFYNPLAVQQGKQTFERQWGKRENVDHWQRVNQTVVGGMDRSEMSQEMLDSIARQEAIQDSLEQVADSAQNDPHKREYYLAQIPFTEDQVAASNLIIQDGLYHSGVIFKDKLDHLGLSEKQFMRLLTDFPEFEQMADVYYHLFLLHSRRGEHDLAASYVSRLEAEYPESPWTALLTDPYFIESAQFGEQVEDSLYGATYDAFKADRFGEVRSNSRISEERFPMGQNRDKFIFINGLSKLNNGDGSGCVADMQMLVEKFPQSKLAEMAGMIVNGVKQGRRLHGGKFDLGDVWSRRSVVLSDSDSIAAREFSPERNEKFLYIIAYHPDSIDQNKLLFELARYNFTNFMVRDFDIKIEDTDGPTHMCVSGFRNYDEALQYARQLHQQEHIMAVSGVRGTAENDSVQGSRILIISEPNLALLGRQFSYDDYAKFYEENFVPLEIDKRPLLSEPAEIGYEKEPVFKRNADEENADSDEDSGEKFGEEIEDSSENFNLEIEDSNEVLEVEETEIPVEESGEEIIVPEEKTTVVSEDNSNVVSEENSTTVVSEENSNVVSEENSTTVSLENEDVTNNDDNIIVNEADDLAQPKKEAEIIAVEEETKSEADENTFVLDDDDANADDDEIILFDDDDKTAKTTKSDDDDVLIILDDDEVAKKDNKTAKKDDKTTNLDPKKDDKTAQKDEKNSKKDDKSSKKDDKKQEKEKEDGYELEDEYFELNGF
ncbi:MAG: tetratricopeptide repeat protein [Prevotella sp.]|nr:tetratricopeptide repeat protein [Prevotella sp.]